MERIGLEPGTEIGGYRIVHQLGAGAMGVVYRAVDGGGQAVAFKILRSNVLDGEDLRERLNREAASLRKVRHPAVAALLDVELDSDESFIVTELVEGPTLEAYVADNGPLDSIELVDLARRLTSALDAVHSAGVVHRDLKPNNVLMGNDGAVLIDFGIAHGLQDSRLTATGLVVGTPGYLAPELINGADPSEDTDLWGLAAVLTFAATGRAPFGYGGFEAVIARAMAGKPDVEGLDERVAYALRGALAVKTENRWSPQDVIAELTDVSNTPGTFPIFYQDEQHDATEVLDTTNYLDPHATVPQGVPQPPRSTQGLVGNRDGHTAVFDPNQQATRLNPVPLPPSYELGTGFPGATEQPAELSWDAGTFDERDGQIYPAAGAELGDEFGNEYEEPEAAYERELPPRRIGPFVAAALAIVAFACLAPFLTLIVVAAVFVGFSVIGVVWDAFQSKREQRGVRKREGAMATLAFPWHVLKGFGLELPSLVFSVAPALLLGGILYWIAVGEISRDAANSMENTERIIVLAAPALLFLLLAWYGPLTNHTRTGGRLLMKGLFPGKFATMILVLLLLGIAAYVGFVVWQGEPINWWPVQEAFSNSI